MTKHREHQTTDTNGSELQQFLLDAQPLQQLRTELCEFVAQTHRRLDSLSQSLLMSEGNHQVVSQETDAEATQSESPASPPINVDVDSRISEQRDQCESTEQPPACEAVTSVSKPSAVAPTEDQVDQVDPLQRLAAIKNRLAQQMQNAS